MTRSFTADIRGLVGLLAITSLTAFAGCGAQRQPAVAKQDLQADVPLIDGTALRLASEGEVVVVAFFTTWCPASASMLAALDEIRASKPQQAFMAIALDEGDRADQVLAFVKAKQLKISVGFDVDGNLARQLNLPTVPSLVMIDRKGVVRHLHAGYHGVDDRLAILSEVNTLLREEAPTIPRAERAPEVVAAE